MLSMLPFFFHFFPHHSGCAKGEDNRQLYPESKRNTGFFMIPLDYIGRCWLMAGNGECYIQVLASLRRTQHCIRRTPCGGGEWCRIFMYSVKG